VIAVQNARNGDAEDLKNIFSKHEFDPLSAEILVQYLIPRGPGNRSRMTILKMMKGWLKEIKQEFTASVSPPCGRVSGGKPVVYAPPQANTPAPAPSPGGVFAQECC
jgi:hypothetical protein